MLITKSKYKRARIRIKLQRLAFMELKLILQLMLITTIYYLGVGISYYLPIKIPGNILGMLLLLICLLSGVLKSHHIHEGCSFLLKYMAIFFLPAAVALMGCTGLLQGFYLKFALVCIITTIIVFIATVSTVSMVSHLMAKRQLKRGKIKCLGI